MTDVRASDPRVLAEKRWQMRDLSVISEGEQSGTESGTARSGGESPRARYRATRE
jgi:hypothetical protein